MTDIDRAIFFDLFHRVARTFGRKPDAVLASDYFHALQAVDLEHVQTAADTLVKGSRYWPKPVDWLDAAQRAKSAQRGFSTFTPPVVVEDGTSETVYHCGRCQDTGWCPECGCELGRLDILKHCPAHPYVRYGLNYSKPLMACACRATNPAWQANHQTRYVEAETHRG